MMLVTHLSKGDYLNRARIRRISASMTRWSSNGERFRAILNAAAGVRVFDPWANKQFDFV